MPIPTSPLLRNGSQYELDAAHRCPFYIAARIIFKEFLIQYCEFLCNTLRNVHTRAVNIHILALIHLSILEPLCMWPRICSGTVNLMFAAPVFLLPSDPQCIRLLSMSQTTLTVAMHRPLRLGQGWLHHGLATCLSVCLKIGQSG